MSKNELMKVYQSDLMVVNATFHNIHWNIEGKEFMQVHKLTEEMYDDFFEKFDELAELLKMRGEKPPVTLSEYVNLSSVKEEEYKVFSTKEALELVVATLEHLRSQALALREAANEEDDFVVVAAMEDHVAGYDKQLWFTKSTQK